MDSRTPIATFLANLISGRFRRMMEHCAGTLAGDPEALHDMRVGSRRLRSILQNGRGVFRRPRRYRRLEGNIEDFTTALGHVRDLDVILDYLAVDRREAPPSDLPHLDRLAAHLAGRREERRATMQRVLTGLNRPRRAARFLAFFAGAAEAKER
jgi:CHAD domain-containing protein